MSVARPKLRPIEAIPLRQQGQQLLGLRDPQGFTDQISTVSVAAAPILRCLDGEHTLPEIQHRVASETQITIPLDVLEKFLAQLDEALLLESPRFVEFRATQLRQYREAAARPAAHAGASYPADADKLRAMLDGHYAGIARPATPAASRAFIIPHIDLRVGGPTYAHAYANLPAAETFVILGVAHAPTSQRFAGTRKDFQTPLGVLPVDQKFLETLAGKLPFDLFADELAHRREHSIEFQAVYLQHRFGAVPIVPILAGSFHDLMTADREPSRDRQVAAFIQALRETILASDRRVTVIASVDLAHVGARFGDEFTINECVLEQLEFDDRAMLERVTAGDAAGMCRYVYLERDRRRVDAWPAVYTMMRALDLREGRLLHYAQNHEQDTNSVVTFASLSLA